MANDDIKIKLKFNSTVENPSVKGKIEPENSVEQKEVHVFHDNNEQNSTPDVDLSKTVKKQEEQKKAKEFSELIDIDAMAKIPMENGEIFNLLGNYREYIFPELSRKEILQKLQENLSKFEIEADENYKTAQNQYNKRKKGTDDSLYKSLMYKTETEKYNLSKKYNEQLKEILKNADKLSDEELKELLAFMNLPVSDEKKQEIINFYFHKTQLTENELNETVNSVVKGKMQNNQQTMEQVQDVLNSEGFVSYLTNGLIGLVGGTTSQDVQASINIENDKIAELVNTAKTKDARAFMKKYKEFTGVEFNVESFKYLANTEQIYNQALAINQGLSLANELEKNPYGIRTMHVMQTESEIGERNYNFDMTKTDNPSPLQKALLTKFQNNSLLATLWILGTIKNNNLEGKSEKQIYAGLVKEFVKTQKQQATDFFKDKSFEEISYNYENALKNAYGNNITQEMLQKYMENQSRAKSGLQMAMLVGCGIFASPAVLGLIKSQAIRLAVAQVSTPAGLSIMSGGITAFDKLTSKNGFQDGDVESIMLEMALSYAGFKIFGAVNKSVGTKLLKSLGENPAYADIVVSRLTAQAAGGGVSGLFCGSAGAVISGEKDLDKILMQGIDSGVWGVGFALLFGAITESVLALKGHQAKGQEIKSAQDNLLKILDSDAKLKPIADKIREEGLTPELLHKALIQGQKVFHPDNKVTGNAQLSTDINKWHDILKASLKDMQKGAKIKTSKQTPPQKAEVKTLTHAIDNRWSNPNQDYKPACFKGSDIADHHDVNSDNLTIRRTLEAIKVMSEIDTIDSLPAYYTISKEDFIKSYNEKLEDGDIQRATKTMQEYDKQFEQLPPLEKDCLAYRGRAKIKGEISDRYTDFEVIDKAKPGDVIVPDTGYAYCGFDKSLASHWDSKVTNERAEGIMYTIRIPKGAKVSRNLEHGGEVLMPRGAKYKLISKEKIGDHTNVVLEYILPEETQTETIENNVTAVVDKPQPKTTATQVTTTIAPEPQKPSLKIAGEFEKANYYFVEGYNDNALSPEYTHPQAHRKKVCFSAFNRYPAQTDYLKSMMSKSKSPLRVFNIGVAQGQEPLTHLNSAFALSQETGKPLSSFIDLTTTDILSEPPALPHKVTEFDKTVLDKLTEIYDKNSGKSHWGTPIETLVEQMLEQGQKQDAILFNNVLQHMTTNNEDELFSHLAKLLNLVNDNGVFCFTVGSHGLQPYEIVRINRMLDLLKQNGFEEIGEKTGIFKKIKTAPSPATGNTQTQNSATTCVRNVSPTSKSVRFQDKISGEIKEANVTFAKSGRYEEVTVKIDGKIAGEAKIEPDALSNYFPPYNFGLSKKISDMGNCIYVNSMSAYQRGAGSILHKAIAQRSIDLGYQGRVCLDAAWASFPFHYTCGFREFGKGIETKNSPEAEEIIAEYKKTGVRKDDDFGGHLMFLTPEKAQELLADININTKKATAHEFDEETTGDVSKAILEQVQDKLKELNIPENEINDFVKYFDGKTLTEQQILALNKFINMKDEIQFKDVSWILCYCKSMPEMVTTFFTLADIYKQSGFKTDVIKYIINAFLSDCETDDGFNVKRAQELCDFSKQIISFKNLLPMPDFARVIVDLCLCEGKGQIEVLKIINDNIEVCKLVPFDGLQGRTKASVNLLIGVKELKNLLDFFNGCDRRFSFLMHDIIDGCITDEDTNARFEILKNFNDRLPQLTSDEAERIWDCINLSLDNTNIAPTPFEMEYLYKYSKRGIDIAITFGKNGIVLEKAGKTIKIMGNSEDNCIIKFNDGKREIFLIKDGKDTLLGAIGDNAYVFKKLLNAPENLNYETLISFFDSSNFNTGDVVAESSAPYKTGHSEINLPGTKSIVSDANISKIAQLDTQPNQKDSARTVHHYQDGTTVVNDFETDILTGLTQNPNGMTIHARIGNEEIKMTSEITDVTIKITDEFTGKSISIPITEILSTSKNIYSEYLPPLDAENRAKKTQALLKKLSPTTILNMLYLKKTYPDFEFPYISEQIGGISFLLEFVKFATLTDSPEITSHEVQHAMTTIFRLTEDKTLIKSHKNEVELSRGLDKLLAIYAINAAKPNLSNTIYDTPLSYKRGLDELISIISIADEYGIELSGRLEAVRKTFPETTKAIAEKRMKMYKTIMYDLGLTDTKPADALTPVKSDKNDTLQSAGILPNFKLPAFLKKLYGKKTVTTSTPVNSSKRIKSSIPTSDDMKAVHKMDKENFRGHYEIESGVKDYIKYLQDNDITTKVFKNDKGEVIGYYQLESVKNGKLYIYSIGVPKSLSRTRTSYAVLKSVQDEIKELVNSKGIKKVVLDVDADNQTLVKLYKKFGFEITDENSGIEDGHPYHDYRMEIDVAKYNEKQVTKTQETQPTQESVVEQNIIPKTNIKPEITSDISKTKSKSDLSTEDEFKEAYPEEYKKFKDYLTSDNYNLRSIQLNVLHTLKKKYNYINSGNIDKIVSDMSPDETVAEIQVKWMKMLMKNGINLPYLMDSFTVIKANLEIAQIQMKIIEKFAEKRPDIKFLKLESLIKRISSNKDIAQLQLDFTDKLLAKYPDAKMDSLERLIAIPASSDDIECTQFIINWAMKKLSEGKDLDALSFDMRVIKHNINVAQMQLDWFDNVSLKYPKISSWKWRSILDSIAGNENVAKLQLDYANKFLSEHPQFNGACLGEILSSVQGKSILINKGSETLAVPVYPDENTVKLKFDIADMLLKTYPNITEQEMKELMSSIKDKPEIVVLQAEWLKKAPVLTIAELKSILPYILNDIKIARLQFDWVDKYLSSVPTSEPINTGIISAVLSSMYADESAAKMQLELVEKVNPDKNTFISSSALKSLLLSLSWDKDIAQEKTDLILRFVERWKKFSDTKRDISAITRILRTMEPRNAKYQVDIINMLLDKFPDVEDYNLHLITDEISKDVEVAKIQAEILSKFLEKYAGSANTGNKNLLNPVRIESPDKVKILKAGTVQHLLENILPPAEKAENALILFDKLLKTDINPNKIPHILGSISKDKGIASLQSALIDKITAKGDLAQVDLQKVLDVFNSNEDKTETLNKLLDMYDKGDLTPNALRLYIQSIDVEIGYPRLVEQIGKEKVAALSESVLTFVCAMCKKLYKTSIEDMTTKDKKDLLSELRYFSDKFEPDKSLMTIKKEFPLLPLSSEEYINLQRRLISSLAKDNPRYKELNDVITYFVEHKNVLQQADMQILSETDVINLLIRKSSFDTTMFFIDTGCADVLKRATELKINGYKEFRKDVSVLGKNLPEEAHDLLKEKLSGLKFAEQKLEKLQILAGLADAVSPTVLVSLIEGIKSAEITSEQQASADRIFSSDKPYPEQIEEFIREFKVPEKNQHIIRRYLEKAKLNEKILTPPSIEKQIEIMGIKIRSIENNTSMPSDKKERYLTVLKSQLEDIKSHPEKYSLPKINTNAFKPFAEQIEAYINLPNEQEKFNADVGELIYKKLGIVPTDDLLRSINYDGKYIAKLFAMDNNSQTKDLFAQLMDLLMKNPGKKLTEIIDTIPENAQTHKLFEENGLDYKKWITFDKDFNEPFKVKVDAEEALLAVKYKLLLEIRGDGFAQRLNSEELAKINKKVSKIILDASNVNDLLNALVVIRNEFETNEYWKTDNPDVQLFKQHICIHELNIKALENLKNINEEFSVRLWDNDNIGRNIFFGNHVGCCTSIGGCNDFAASQHLVNSFVNGIEIVDKGGKSMGNSMCYFALIDGKLTFVIDSFEANGKLGAAKEVTNAIIEFAKKVCKKMGRPDANIMFGPNYNKVNFERCVLTDNHTIEILGRAPGNTYIDSIGGCGNINVPALNRSMHEIHDL